MCTKLGVYEGLLAETLICDYAQNQECQQTEILGLIVWFEDVSL